MHDVMTEEQTQAPARPRRRWLSLVIAVTAPALTAVLWWATTTDPLVQGSGAFGVRSDVAPVAALGDPVGDTTYIATYVEGERVTLLFSLANTGRLPLRVSEVFPVEERLSCGWVVDQVLTSESAADDYRPFSPLWLSPEEIVDVSVSGRFDCGGRQGTQQAMSSFPGVPVRWSVGGLVARTSTVPIGYSFGWTEDPERYLAGVVDRDAAVRSP